MTGARGQGEIRAVGSRSIAIGGDAVRNLINTGDNNQFFIGQYERLADVYIQPWSLYRELKLDHFIGRGWLIARVDAFLEVNARGYLIIEGEAGVGKTAFLAWLAKQRGYIHHFARLTADPEDLEAPLKSLCAQLIRTWHLEAETVGGMLPPSAARPDFFHHLLEEAARSRDEHRPGERIVLVIDGLDEVRTPPGRNPLGLPADLPPGVYIVASQRNVSVRLLLTTPTASVRLDARDGLNLADMRDYLVGTVLPELRDVPDAAALVDTLMRKCQGVWIYLYYLIEEIRVGNRALDDLDRLPVGLWQYYAQFWSEWQEKHSDAWDNVHLPLLTTLAAVVEPAPLGLLCTLAGIDEGPPVRRILLREWRPFLEVRGEQGQESCYAVYHGSLRDFLEGRVSMNEMRASDSELATELAAATSERHARIADHYFEAWGGLENGLDGLRSPTALTGDDEYGLRQISVHLEKAGRTDDLHALLTLERRAEASPGGEPDHATFENTWYTIHERLGDLAGYTADVARAWRIAEQDLRRAASNPSRGVALGRQCRYALVTASLSSRATNVPSTLLAAFVANGVYSLTQALMYVRQVADADQRAAAIQAIAPLLEGSQHLRDALATVRMIGDQIIRAGALESIAPQLDEDSLQEALEVAIAMPRAQSRALALAALVHVVGEQKRDDVLSAALGAAEQMDADGGCWPWVPLASNLPVDDRGKAVGHVVLDPDDGRRARTLAALLPRLAKADAQAAVWEVVGSIPRITDYDDRSKAAFHLAVALAETGDHGGALTLARLIDHWFWGALALREIWSHLDQPHRDQALGIVLGMRESGDGRLGGVNQYIRSETDVIVGQFGIQWLVPLTVMLPSLDTADRSQYAEFAVEACRGADPIVRVAAMTSILPLMSVPDHSAVLAESLDSAAAIADRTEWARAITGLLPHLPPADRGQLLEQARTAVEAIDDADMRSQGIRAMAVALGRLGDPRTARAVARDIDSPRERSRALSMLLPYLDPVAAAEVFDQARTAARSEPEPSARVALLVALLEACPPQQVEDVVEEAVREVGVMTSEEARIRALLQLLPHLRETDRIAAVVQMREVVDAVNADLLADLALALAELGLVREALKTTIAIDASAVRVRALCELARHLDQGLVREALAIARATRARDIAAIIAQQEDEHSITVQWSEFREQPYVLESGKEWVAALIALAPYVPESERPSVLKDARAAIATIESPEAQIWALCRLAPHAGEDREQCVAAALEIARANPDQGQGEEISIGVALAPLVSREVRDDLLTRAERAAVGADSPIPTVHLVRMLAAYGFVERALNLTLGIDDSYFDIRFRAKALADLCPALMDLEQNALVSLMAESLHVLTIRGRREVLIDLCALEPVLTAIGADALARELATSIAQAGRWWP